MKKIFILFVLYSLLLCNDIEIANSRENAITNAIKLASSSVVGVNITQIRQQRKNPFFDPFWDDFFPQKRSYKVESFGSGVVISSDGYIITNQHVIDNSSEIIITTFGGDKYEAKIIGSDELTDIALLKIDTNNLKPVLLGDSDSLIIGEWAIAIGNPLGLFTVSNQATATVGIISGINMDFGQKRSGRVYQNMIQTDASINPGNSGGPLINSIGEVIGINTFIITGDSYSQGSIGIGFAIPINLVKGIIEDLKLYGKIKRNYNTGIQVQDLDRMMKKYLKLEMDYGVIITRIELNSSGYRSGLKTGDIILKVNGESVEKSSDIVKIIDEGLHRTGDIIILSIMRNNIIEDVNLKLESENTNDSNIY
jgi:serine protease Do